MRLVALIGAALITGGMAGAAGATVLFDPKGEFSTFFKDLKYDPSGACSKPTRPFSDDSYARQQYLNDAKEYLLCMQRAAEPDARYANDVVADGLKEKSDEFVREVESGY